MKLSNQFRLFSLLAAFFCLLFSESLALGQHLESVAILPFSLNASPEKKYLRDGLRDMLGSRIRAEAGANILPKKDIEDQLKKSGGNPDTIDLGAFARKVGAEYIVYGSITSLGAGISIDTRVFNATAPADKSVESFYATATTNEQVMQGIDTLSWEIIERIFHKKRPASPVKMQEVTMPNPDISGSTTPHPEKAFMSSGGGFGIHSTRNFLKTRNFDMGVQSIDLGDIDGDGEEEVIIAEKTKILIFDRNGNKLNSIGSIKMYDRYQIHSVNAADLDGDGRAEIYISAADPKTPGSRAVKWDGTKFVDIFREVRWYIRPMDVPGRGLSLVGQKGGLLPVEAGIYLLSINKETVSVQERLPIPEKINLFDFIYADLDGDSQEDLIALDESFKLQVIMKGSVVWKSAERFCGTKRFLGGSTIMTTGTALGGRDIVVDGVGDVNKEIYVPSRLLVADVDHDGMDDIILNRNQDSLSDIMPRSRQYTSGTLTGLKWNGLGLEEMWQTRKIDGYIVDYQVKSHAKKLTNGEADEMFIGLILNAGTFDALLGDQSTVIIYPFEFEMSETR